jgi:hypothetical protein
LVVFWRPGAKRAAYSWQYSHRPEDLDAAPADAQGQDGGLGLTSGRIYYFCSQSPKGGAGDWGQVVALLVT